MESSLNLEKLNSNDPKTKYAFAKELMHTVEETPEKLYAGFGDFIKLLDDENNVIKWTAIDIVGHLSAVDSENKINRSILDKLFELFHDSKLITCNHAIAALALAAGNKPEFKDEIIRKLLLVQENDFETDECEAIATGKVLDALNPFFEELKENKNYISLVKSALKSPRNSTKQKAGELLKKLEK